MPKRTTITAHTKQNLIDAFWVLYCQKPLTQITVKEIVARAGYNRSTFYESLQTSRQCSPQSKMR